jgi:choline-sulfatase
VTASGHSALALCLAGVLALGLLPVSRAGQAVRAQRRPPVFIYLVDTLRVDHLGCYGYPKPVSPHLDAFAREASVFRAIAPSSWTKASVASLFTGLSPNAHGAQDRGDTLTPDATTLAGLLGAAGYRTYALYANAWVSETFGIDQGFAERRLLIGPSDRLNRELFGWLGRTSPDDRLFVYVHTIDPHAPYAPPAGFRARFAAPPRHSLERASIEWLEDLAARGRRGEVIPTSQVEEITALYDAEIAFNDLQFGLFLEELKRRALYDDSLIVFTSDHGEELFDHGGVSHGQTLYAEVLDIPLIVKWPRGTVAPAGAADFRAQLVDVLPTILDCLGLPKPPEVEGRSLLDPSAGSGSPEGDPVFSYLDLDSRKVQSVTEGHWKLIRRGAADETQPVLELYDLESGERADLRQRHPAAAARLRAVLENEAARHPRRPPPPQAVLSGEVTEELRALGYLP